MTPSPGYLLDTNVLVALIRGNTTGEAIDQAFSIRSAMHRQIISVVTIGEMNSLARQFNWGTTKRHALTALLDEIVCVDIHHPDILDAYGEIDEQSRSLGRPMGKNDVWIAATSKVLGIALLTTDRDFDHLHPSHLQRVFIDPTSRPKTG